MEDILRNAAFALSEQPQPVSLLAIPRILTDPHYRRAALRHVRNPAVQVFFQIYEHGWTKQFREEAISPVLNKVNAFITNPLLRAVIGQATSAFRFRWLIDSGKILLCDLSKGALGEDVSALLGSLITTKLYLAALSRQEIPEAERRPFVLYMDEVQNFIHGVKLPTILSEARKYGLALTIATQVITQLPKDSVDAVFGNCATVISFRVGGEDAETLTREFATVIPATNLQELPDYKMYVRTMSAQPDRPASPRGPITVKTFPAFKQQGTENDKARVIETSSRRYTRPRAQVDAQLNKFILS
jgi:TraM recognition site of TraD and TraG